MARVLTAEDIDILGGYAAKGDRRHYWSYLANKGDPYATLALGVVLNNTPPGQVANNFFWGGYKPDSQGLVNEKELNGFGVKLMQADLDQRRELVNC
ncbi:MAG TPA: hypothetical protein VJ654_06650 [Noviherbaspirillum sp.]|nr:hypothetical protein [Noviherbaspirillum sp.]